MRSRISRYDSLMMMFAILFGLSMDYEVFLLSRIREEHLSGRDNDGSIVADLASMARVIALGGSHHDRLLLSFLLNDDRR